MKKTLSYSAFTFLALAILSYAGVALAADPQVGDICKGDALANLFCNTSLPDMLNAMFQLSISIGGILAMLRISWAGWLYMGSGFDNFGSKTKAKKVFTDAVMGLLILLAIYLILYQINPDILKLSIVQDLPASSAPTPTPPAVTNTPFTQSSQAIFDSTQLQANPNNDATTNFNNIGAVLGN